VRVWGGGVYVMCVGVCGCVHFVQEENEIEWADTASSIWISTRGRQGGEREREKREREERQMK
jgi:hypothetical protein